VDSSSSNPISSGAPSTEGLSRSESTLVPKVRKRSKKSSTKSRGVTLGLAEVDDAKARVMIRDAWGEKPRAIAEAEGLEGHEVRKMLRNQSTEWVEIKEKIRDHLVRRLYEKATFNLESINPVKAARESNVQNATTAAILIDKARLLEGQPTNISASVNVDVARLMQPEVLKQLIVMRGGVANLRPEHRMLAEKLGISDTGN
jgi:hypothetical protein